MGEVGGGFDGVLVSGATMDGELEGVAKGVLSSGEGGWGGDGKEDRRWISDDLIIEVNSGEKGVLTGRQGLRDGERVRSVGLHSPLRLLIHISSSGAGKKNAAVKRVRDTVDARGGVRFDGDDY